MRETNDGFVIAEKDLELRGPGELLGTRQTGLPAFRVADLARDAGLLPLVRELADRLLAEAPGHRRADRRALGRRRGPLRQRLTGLAGRRLRRRRESG